MFVLAFFFGTSNVYVHVLSQQKEQPEVAQDGSECAWSDSDGGFLPGDFGDGHLGINALQERREEVHGRWHGDHLTGWAQYQLACWHLYSYW